MNKNCSSVNIEREKESSWVINLEKKLACHAAGLSDEEIQWKKPSIFRLPDFVRMMKPDVFAPKAVAIGPYHHDRSHLQPLESHKERALHHFLKRGVKSLGVYEREMKSVVEELQGSYFHLEEKWKNQAGSMITEVVVKFFAPTIYTDKGALTQFKRTNHGFHALDIYRRSRLFIPTKTSQNRGPPAPIINFAVMRSATRLHEAGITFKQSDSNALTTIKFDRGILTIPRITVDDSTEYEFLNMVALEHLHAECGSDISSYVAFMDALVDSAKDVQLLSRHRLVNNGLGSDEEFASLFNRMGKEVIVDQGGSLGSVQQDVEKYCRKCWNNCWADLKHTYFQNPWSVISVVVAAFVILLTILSTVISILQWKNI